MDALENLGSQKRAASWTAGVSPSSGDMLPLLDLLRLRVAQIQECDLGVFYYSFKIGSGENFSQKLGSLESWPVAPGFDGRDRAALALVEILARPMPEESSVLPHLFHLAQQHLTRNEILQIVVAVEAMQEWKENEVYAQKSRA